MGCRSGGKGRVIVTVVIGGEVQASVGITEGRLVGGFLHGSASGGFSTVLDHVVAHLGFGSNGEGGLNAGQRLVGVEAEAGEPAAHNQAQAIAEGNGPRQLQEKRCRGEGGTVFGVGVAELDLAASELRRSSEGFHMLPNTSQAKVL